jgi:thioredoxin-disulfide reductase
MFDLIIIGAGPTGLTAALYAARRMMKVLIISKNMGGQVIWASHIKNYPGIDFIGGVELINKMQKQVKDLGVEIKINEIKEIRKTDDGNFQVQAGSDVYSTKTLILAMGLAPKQLGLANEDEFTGKGISYCATCDGPLFKNKTVAVVGGGNAALDAAEVMSKVATKVYLVYRREQFRGFESLAEEVKKKSNIEILLNSEIQEITGGEKLERIKVKNGLNQAERELEVDGLFIEIGHEPKTEIVADLVERDEKRQIIVDMNGQTSCAGIFAAGDVIASEFKQIIIGCGQGAVAALSAYKYLQVGKK